MDISTRDEEEEIILDDDQGPDEIDAIYSAHSRYWFRRGWRCYLEPGRRGYDQFF